jgi:hypothetical protein
MMQVTLVGANRPPWHHAAKTSRVLTTLDQNKEEIKG